ncbi:aldo/keto reductase [Zunongwangia sp. F363]|uniref:Aldo/keto reductase n=1 Tax=Autumnicola tepida TaxID=3075595 RepID=A0ABU3CD16_9FLAO|nr:aldo/keto reductase [Zunongwangia sp. F363]MDT0644237.1 aldo/keto reductase [Zunongwangia sp. F363]
MLQSKKIGLGTVQFGMDYGISNGRGQTSKEEVRSILNCARKNQIKFLDSASAYGNAEEILGICGVEDFNIVSKFMPSEEGVSLQEQLNSSFEKLRVESLYGYLAHRPLALIDEPDAWQELLELKKAGKIEKIGFSLNQPEELEKLLNIGLLPDLVQVPYNYFDRRFEKAIEDLKNGGCEIHTRSAFLQGLFFVEPSKLSSFFDEIKLNLEEIQNRESSLAGDLLNFVLSNEMIDKVIIGVEDKSQLENNFQMLKSAKELPFLTKEIPDNILIPSLWPKR